MTGKLIVVAALLCAFGAWAASGMTPQQAKKLLEERGEPQTPEGLLGILNTSMPDGPEIIQAYLALGIRADQPISYDEGDGKKHSIYPLSYVMRFACTDPVTAKNVKILLDAGAPVNTRDEMNGRTPAFGATSCPEVLRLILDRNPDLTIKDNFGNSVLKTAAHEGTHEAVKMLLEAGYRMSPAEKKELVHDAGYDPELKAILQGTQPPAASTPALKSAVDWKTLPPYPDRTPTQAKKLLLQPGAATTVQDEFWDAITSHEPLRLALSLRAGADVRVTRPVTGYTPLVLLAERCSDSDAEQQAALAQQLVDAGADVSGVDANNANALTMAAGDCPLPMVNILIKAGLPLNAVASTGETPLRTAIEHGRADVVAALLEAGVDPKKEPYNAKKLASAYPDIQALLKKHR